MIASDTQYFSFDDSPLNDLFILSDLQEDTPLQIKLEEQENTPKLNEKQKRRTQEYIRGPYKKYSQESKVKAVENLKKSNMDYNIVCQQLKINKKNLIRWVKKAENNWKGSKAGRKAFDIKMENNLSEWIKKQTKITNKEIRMKALELSNLKNFKASKGWLWKFIRRQNLKQQINLINNQ